eukprot:gene16693-19831_t
MSEAFQKLSQKLRSLFKVADRQAKVSVATRPLLVRSSEPLPDSPRKSSKAEELRREADPQLSSRKNLVSDRNITEPGESTSGRLPDFSGSWYSSETHAIDPFLGAMGVSWAARKLVAAMPIRNEIRTDIDLKTGEFRFLDRNAFAANTRRHSSNRYNFQLPNRWDSISI